MNNDDQEYEKKKEFQDLLMKAILEIIFYVTLGYFAPWYVTAAIFVTHWMYNVVERLKAKKKKFP